MGLVGQYVFGLDIVPMIVVMMAITVGYLALSGMLGATKNMAVQYVILIIAFLAGVYVVGFTQGYSTVMPPLEYGALIDELGRQFSEPFANAGYYLWVATAFSLIFGTCGLPHVLVRFYTVESERTARWSCVWGLFFILLLYWAAPAMAAFGVDLFEVTQGTSAYADGGGMSGAEGDVIVVLAAQYANLPLWFVGLVAAGAMAAAIATTSGLFITASSAVAHDIYTELINPEATQRQQVLIGRLTIVAIGALVTVTAFNPPALIGELVGYAFSLAGIVLFPMFFLGLWWENTNRQGALAGMTVGLLIWITSIVNSVLPKYIGALSAIAGETGALVPIYAQYVPPIGAALIGTPVVFVVTIAVSLATPEPPMETKRLVRQCHSPEPMGQQQSAEDVVATGGGETPADD